MVNKVVTIKDVAQAAGVSVATVSRAINNRSNVAPEVRTHILAIAKELRYVPHAGATSLSARRTHMAGLVLPALHGEYFSELMHGVDGVFRDHHLHLLVASYRSETDLTTVLRNIRTRVDGMLILPPNLTPHSDLRDLLELDKPFVLLNGSPIIPGALQVGIDNHHLAEDMVAHLVEQGYANIAFVNGIEGNPDSAERQRGYRDAMARLLPDTPIIEFSGDYTEPSGYQAGLAVLEHNRAHPDRPIDAVFCANDWMALGMQHSLLANDVRIPQDIAVAGVDDIALARYMPVPLTSVRTDVIRVGQRAAKLLCHLIGGGTHLVDHEMMRSVIEVRQSTVRGARQ